jgi:hypothetical protein
LMNGYGSDWSSAMSRRRRCASAILNGRQTVEEKSELSKNNVLEIIAEEALIGRRGAQNLNEKDTSSSESSEVVTCKMKEKK